ncbi:MAG: FAD-binding oxidoreductase [Rhodospirillaceae bacterium]|nr:FAD-binding oxidoreductase [Rhodospirillaceae bacterium]
MSSPGHGRRYAQHDGAAPTWYEASARTHPTWPALDGDARADVCVIGGGYTGLSCALHLAERGYRTVLLEARRIGNGASGRNGGQLGSGHRRDQFTLERELGDERARLLWSLAEEAKALARERVARHGIDCDLKSGIAIAAHRPRHARALVHEAEHLRSRYGYDRIDVLDRSALRAEVASDGFHGGLMDRGAGHLHPLDYARGLARAASEAGVDIREGSPVTGLTPGAPCTVSACPHAVKADAVVLACNGYLDAFDPGCGKRVMPINNFILATEPLGAERARALIPNDVAVVDTRFVVNYFRLSADGRLLFGGGETTSSRLPADPGPLVRRCMLRIFPQLADVRIDHAWGGTLAITRTRMPSIGRLEGGLYYGQGYSGHGVALATLGGALIAEAISGTLERFDVFARLPQAPFPGGRFLRWPTLALALTYGALRDRL